MHSLLDREVDAQLAGIEGWRDDHVRHRLPIIRSGEVGRRSPRLVMAFCSRRARTPERAAARLAHRVWGIGLSHNSATTSS